MAIRGQIGQTLHALRVFGRGIDLIQTHQRIFVQSLRVLARTVNAKGLNIRRFIRRSVFARRFTQGCGVLRRVQNIIDDLEQQAQILGKTR